MDSPQRNCPLITTKIESLHLDTLVSSQHMLHHQPFLTKMNLTDQSLMNTPVRTKMPTKEINVNSTIRLQLLTTIVRDQLRIKDRKSLENILRWKTTLEIRNQLINELQEEFEDTKGEIGMCISKKNRRYNFFYKRTNNDQQNIHIKLKIE